MRKRNIAVLLLTVLLLAGLTGCARRGDTSGVEIVVGASEQFSDEDIRGAMDAAMRAFHRGHSGCAMVRLAYNEAYRTCWLAGAGAQDDGNTIVLLASVYARDPGRRSGLTAGETYTDWPIVLERRGSGWHVVSSGYGKCSTGGRHRAAALAFCSVHISSTARMSGSAARSLRRSPGRSGARLWMGMSAQ